MSNTYIPAILLEDAIGKYRTLYTRTDQSFSIAQRTRTPNSILNLSNKITDILYANMYTLIIIPVKVEKSKPCHPRPLPGKPIHAQTHRYSRQKKHHIRL